MPDQHPDEHYVILIDLLGFTHAVQTWPSGRRAELVELVRWIATARSEFKIRVAPSGENFITPAVTTFSDLIVVSFPAVPPMDLPPEEAEAALAAWPAEVLRHMARVAATIASRSLRLGLLLRGGICKGELLHLPDIVFGKAFLEAYCLERETAKLPRLVVADAMADPAFIPDLLRNDAGDDRAYLDYMPQLCQVIGERSDAPAWRLARLQGMAEEVKRHALANPAIAAKWAWFREHFEEGTLGISQ
jgi:hypothetical protein